MPDAGGLGVDSCTLTSPKKCRGYALPPVGRNRAQQIYAGKQGLPLLRAQGVVNAASGEAGFTCLCRRQDTVLPFEQMLEMRSEGQAARHLASVSVQPSIAASAARLWDRSIRVRAVHLLACTARTRVAGVAMRLA